MRLSLAFVTSALCPAEESVLSGVGSTGSTVGATSGVSSVTGSVLSGVCGVVSPVTGSTFVLIAGTFGSSASVLSVVSVCGSSSFTASRPWMMS